MTEIVISDGDLQYLKSALLIGEVELCAVLLANQTTRSNGKRRLLVREILIPPSEQYNSQTQYFAELRPEYVAHISKRASNENCSIVFVHSHISRGAPLFSSVDDEGEVHLAKFLSRQNPELLHAAMVISEGGFRGRALGTHEDVDVISLGAQLEYVFRAAGSPTAYAHKFDRQIRAFGKLGQDVISNLRVAIVGLGGVGSLVAQQLGHLGIGDFLLIDPDTIEPSNLNRVVGATLADIGLSKVDVAARYVQGLNASRVDIERADVTRVKVAELLRDVDLIFSCTDSHGSRAIIQQVAYQYFIPCIDTGVTITTDDGRVKGIYGRVQLLAPGHACLSCSSILDANEVRRDMMSVPERKLDPYIPGGREPAPAVISINGTTASLAVTMFLAHTVGVPSASRNLLYNAVSSSLRSLHVTPDPQCHICSKAGVYALGDKEPLRARLE